MLVPVNDWKSVSKQNFRKEVTFSVEVEVVDTVRENVLYRFGVHYQKYRGLEHDFISQVIEGGANESYVERSLQAYDVSVLAGPFPLELSKLTGEHLVDIACRDDERASQIDTTLVAKSAALP